MIDTNSMVIGPSGLVYDEALAMEAEDKGVRLTITLSGQKPEGSTLASDVRTALAEYIAMNAAAEADSDWSGVDEVTDFTASNGIRVRVAMHDACTAGRMLVRVPVYTDEDINMLTDAERAALAGDEE